MAEPTSEPRADSESLRRLIVTTAVVVTAALVVTWIWNGTEDGSESSEGPQTTTPTDAGTAQPPTSAPSGTTPTSTTGGHVTVPGDAPCPADGWPLRSRVGQLVMVGVDPATTRAAREAVEHHGAGGIFIGGESTVLITSGTLPALRSPDGVAPFVAVDDEGGRVQRIDGLVGSMPSARAMAADLTPEQVQALARRRAEQLLGWGITVNFAPVVDVSDQADREVIGDRAFGADPDQVARYAHAFASGQANAGVLPVHKHFPGHGHADADSHLGSATTPALADLEVDLAPYRDLLNRPPAAAVMVGHLDVPGLTDGTPASISPAAIAGLLRGDLGFDGLVFTDDLSGMRAITDRHTPAEATVRALGAGADVALLVRPVDLSTLLDHLEAAVASGALPEATVDAAVARVLRTKGHPC